MGQPWKRSCIQLLPASQEKVFLSLLSESKDWTLSDCFEIFDSTRCAVADSLGWVNSSRRCWGAS